MLSLAFFQQGCVFFQKFCTHKKTKENEGVLRFLFVFDIIQGSNVLYFTLLY